VLQFPARVPAQGAGVRGDSTNSALQLLPIQYSNSPE